MNASMGHTWDAVIDLFASRIIPIRTIERASLGGRPAVACALAFSPAGRGDTVCVMVWGRQRPVSGAGEGGLIPGS